MLFDKKKEKKKKQGGGGSTLDIDESIEVPETDDVMDDIDKALELADKILSDQGDPNGGRGWCGC